MYTYNTIGLMIYAQNPLRSSIGGELKKRGCSFIWEPLINARLEPMTSQFLGVPLVIRPPLRYNTVLQGLLIILPVQLSMVELIPNYL